MTASVSMMDVATIFEAERAHVWGVLYRMLGSASDADDLLQDTFERVMTKPPSDTSRSWRPWLTRVAVNLARDALRKRRRRKYVGPWLPQVADTANLPAPTTPEARYSARESASYAFLKALEALTPNQRAVLVLRDVFDYTTAETALALDLTEANTKVTLHRARRAMADYDDSQFSLDPGEVQEALGQLMAALLAGDAARTAELLSADVVATNDAGGEYKAALRVVHGADKVARFLIGLGKTSTVTDFELVMLNGMPAIISTIESDRDRVSDWALLRVDVSSGRIAAIDIVIATAKRPS